MSLDFKTFRKIVIVQGECQFVLLDPRFGNTAIFRNAGTCLPKDSVTTQKTYVIRIFAVRSPEFFCCMDILIRDDTWGIFYL
jgi:hypothetical protein